MHGYAWICMEYIGRKDQHFSCWDFWLATTVFTVKIGVHASNEQWDCSDCGVPQGWTRTKPSVALYAQRGPVLSLSSISVAVQAMACRCHNDLPWGCDRCIVEPHTEESLPRQSSRIRGSWGTLMKVTKDHWSTSHKRQTNVKHTRPKRVVHLSFHIFLDTPKVGWFHRMLPRTLPHIYQPRVKLPNEIISQFTQPSSSMNRGAATERFEPKRTGCDNFQSASLWGWAISTAVALGHILGHYTALSPRMVVLQ